MQSTGQSDVWTDRIALLELTFTSRFWEEVRED
jgi:hypothetical protein